MKHILLFTAATVFTLNTAQAQTKLIEKVTKKGNEIIVPYEKYQLSNGLTLLVHEDHSDPIVHIDVTYHVGSAREQEGRSGFAHFFEHMMFQGSDNVKDDEHFKIVTESGGSLNGNTTIDRTKYFETLPANQLEVGLWLEADRMGFLLDSVTQKKFEIQRSTVKNERGQNYDNRPYGLVNEKIGEALYPAGHPYSWSTIGYIEDLNRVDVNDLKKFFLRWYGPNNAVLTVAGDVKPSEVVKMVEKYFGSIPRGPEVKPMKVDAVKLDQDRYISYGDNVRFPMININYPTVAAYHADEAALDALADILAHGKSSIFYQNFEKKQQAVSNRVNHYAGELAGTFNITVLPFPGKTLAQMDSLVRASFDEFEKKGVTDEDLMRFKSKFESNLVSSLTSVSGKAITITDNQLYTGNANNIKNDYARYMNVSKEDVMRVFNNYIKNKYAVILSVYPKGKQEMAAKADNYKVVKRAVDISEGAEYKNLTYNKAKDNFDRRIKPSSGANPVVNVPNYMNEKLDNGLKIIGSKSDEVPSVTLQLFIEAGHRYEPLNKAGIASLTAEMMNEATLKHTAEQISDELDKLGSSIDVSAGDKDIVISVTSLSKNMAATIKLFEEVLMQPKFDDADFERVKKQTLESIANQNIQPVTIADNVFNKLIYGTDNTMSTPNIGTKETVESITLDEVKAYYENNFSPNIATLVIVGNTTVDALRSQLEFLNKWKNKNVTHAVELPTPIIDKTRIYLVNKERAPQSVIRAGFMALPYDATGEYYKTVLTNFSLGGGFTSRINLNLREAHGYTYGCYARFNSDKYPTPYRVTAAVRGNATDSSIVEMFKELKGFADNGPSPEELAFTKSSIGQNDALKYETPGQKAGFLKRILDYNLDKTFVQKQNEILKNLTKAECDALAKKNIPYNNMNIVVVGDKASIYPGLSKLGYEIIELDMQGNKIN